MAQGNLQIVIKMDPLTKKCIYEGCDKPLRYIGMCSIPGDLSSVDINGSLLDQLHEVGIDLPASHPCRKQGGCGISVDYSQATMTTVITHKLGDRNNRYELSDMLRNDSKWPYLVMEMLGKMHMAGSGIYRDGDAYKTITPYIDPNDAIEMASEIYGHTGERVTIPEGKSR